MTDNPHSAGEQPWTDQYLGLMSQLDDARSAVERTRPAEPIDMTDEHVDVLEAQARLTDELYQVAKKFLLERDSPPPVAP